MSADRKRLRETFDAAAELYERARPEYPRDLYEHLLAVTGLQPGDALLEVGCATGKATWPLAGRGFEITCIELGGELAGAAARNLAAFADVRVVNAPFESWRPAPGASFALVFAATSWHWIDPNVRYRRAWELLRGGGHLAFWSATHVFPDDGDPFFRDIQEVYDEIGEGLPADAPWPKPGELPDQRAEIESTWLFDVVSIRQFDWETVYDADGYIDLLNTFSGHIAMQPWQRRHLYDEIRARLADRGNGHLRRHWGAVLHVARRRA